MTRITENQKNRVDSIACRPGSDKRKGDQTMPKYIISLDQGTTSSRCILFDQQGNICSAAQKEFTQIYPQPGWVEHDPMEIWSTQLSVTMEAMGKLGAHYSDIAAIGITNQRGQRSSGIGRLASRCTMRSFGSAAARQTGSKICAGTVCRKRSWSVPV